MEKLDRVCGDFKGFLGTAAGLTDLARSIFTFMGFR